MAMTADAGRIFEDARLMSDAARTLLASGDIRDAAEKAWCSIKRAADALIAARTGTEPRTSSATWRQLRALTSEDPAVRQLLEAYREYQRSLHGKCFYYGECEPTGAIAAAIRDTAVYLRLVEQLVIA